MTPGLVITVMRRPWWIQHIQFYGYYVNKVLAELKHIKEYFCHKIGRSESVLTEMICVWEDGSFAYLLSRLHNNYFWQYIRLMHSDIFCKIN